MGIGSLSTSRGQFAIVEPDASGWDAFAGQHVQGHLLQASGWGVLKQQGGWQARHVLVVGPDGPQAGAQLLLRQLPSMSSTSLTRLPMK